jgi:hypothetical protein
VGAGPARRQMADCKIVPLVSSNPMMEGPKGRFRREARARRDTENTEYRQKRLTLAGRIEKLLHFYTRISRSESLASRTDDSPLLHARSILPYLYEAI